MKQYFYNIVDAMSVFISALLGGGRRMSMSQRLGEVQKFGGAWPFRAMRLSIDWLFLTIAGEKDHSLSSLTGETNTRELWDWTGGKKGDYIPESVAQ